MRRFIILALLAISTSVFAEDFKYLTMGYNNVEKSITLETIQKITFENGQDVVTTSEGSETFPLSQMQKMYFSEMATGIGEIEKVEGGENEKMKGKVFDLSGRKVSEASELSRGFYIVNGKKVIN